MSFSWARVIAEGGGVSAVTLWRNWECANASLASWVACYSNVLAPALRRHWLRASARITACSCCWFRQSHVLVIAIHDQLVDDGFWVKASINACCSHSHNEKQNGHFHNHILLVRHLWFLSFSLSFSLEFLWLRRDKHEAIYNIWSWDWARHITHRGSLLIFNFFFPNSFSNSK